ncbi:hypothetical protein DID88_010292 [Monilinia fructigena]|uniref:Uncharacterized protein n=1 Tax=Monilinia fructigena TaxID=38457 RepID=A0A395IP74_9HELO|nr:hypothetical protein DID88_010292 [Monilinia fructigena]
MIITPLEKYEDRSIEPWDVAIHGTVASNKQQALDRLLEKEGVDAEYSGPDGWTALYTARRYESDRMEDTLNELVSATSSITLGLKRRSCWHPNDRFPGLKLGSDKTALSTIDVSSSVSATTNPLCINFLAGTQDRGGFIQTMAASKKTERNHGEDFNTQYLLSYGEGEVIGCGVNFVENCAFYTKGGNVIRRAFENMRGKLNPAVAMDTLQECWEITTVFPDEDGKSAGFIFQEDYDSIQTPEPPNIKREEPQNIEKEDSQCDDDYDSEIVLED